MVKLARSGKDALYSAGSRLPGSRPDTTNSFSLKQKLVGFCIGLLCIFLTLIAFAPAVWLSSLLEYQTKGRFALGDAQGSLWNGSAFIGVATSKNSDLTPLLPGRFTWHLSPILFLGQIDLNLENSSALQQPVNITGTVRHIQVSPSGLLLPADRLSAFGAPLNTLRPSGDMTLSWNVLRISTEENSIAIDGAMKLTMQSIASALSPIKPLGSYVMNFVWHGRQAQIDLKTLQGPLLLSGQGALLNGSLQFSGQAEAEAGQEDKLANLLNLLGQRRLGADKNVIALEFK